jgi:YD repeat-containing protein
MNGQDALTIVAPTLPKGGGAIQSIGSAWGSVGTTGAATLEVPLPISPGRGIAPALALTYASTSGNSPFGMGWSLSPPKFVRRTATGVPPYGEDDEILAPSGAVLVPARRADGTVDVDTVDRYGDLPLEVAYEVMRYLPEVEGAFDRIEYWRPPTGAGFWLVHGADGQLYLFGKRAAARIADSDPMASGARVAEWLLEETVTPTGEHVLYEYRSEDGTGLDEQQARYDHRTQRYLSCVRYGNVVAEAGLYLWDEVRLPAEEGWHFALVFDYGERPADTVPRYAAATAWSVRTDPYSSFAYGFELRTWRLCRQVLMFHRFPELGLAPVLVRSLILEHEHATTCTRLRAVYERAHGHPESAVAEQPPLEFAYHDFSLPRAQHTRFDHMPGLNDGQPYQLVDLYGEGLPGVLYRENQGWWYREPVRAENSADPNAVAYEAWNALPTVPLSNTSSTARQWLMDLTGYGQLEWIVAQPGMAGFFTLNEDRSWSGFAPFAAFPQEFFHPQGQLADLMGSGLSDVVMIGPRSVRLYANHRETGFAAPIDVLHPKDPLPVLSDSAAELVAFADVLGSGQQHLVRIRHNEVRCWPTLGHGRFGASRTLPLQEAIDTAQAFDASRIRLADLDGSGAADLVYLTATHALIFVNRGGNGFDPPYRLPWPEGVRYDRLCQVSVADLQGLGCSSLILTVPHMAPRHWRCDFVAGAKPYLLCATNNNMGAAGAVTYRSSAQEWLDEKQEARRVDPNWPAISHLPFALHVVQVQTQFDEITGNQLTQRFQYRSGYFDGHEREFRGFGLVLQSDTEVATDPAMNASVGATTTAPLLIKTWYHTGRELRPLLEGRNESDPQAVELGAHWLDSGAESASSLPLATADSLAEREAARALAGMILRTETYGRDEDPAAALPYAVSQSRYHVRQLQPPQAGAEERRAARHTVMLPLLAETVTCLYERIPDDPRCTHTVHLEWDEFGFPVRSAMVHYARRKQSGNQPPFSDEHEKTWWRDTHDESQQHYYLSESCSESIHLTDSQAWRLGLPYRQWSYALVYPKSALLPAQVSYEGLIAPDGPLGPAAPRELTGASVQRYQGAEDGHATFEALPAYTETAELDAQALEAYAEVLPEETELAAALTNAGYEPMPVWFAEPGTEPVLWSRSHNFPSFAPQSAFRRLIAIQPTRSHGLTRATYDAYGWQVRSITEPDGCMTQVRYDYRVGLPIEIIDPNQNVQEARYDGWGRVIATSLHGHELGLPIGFDPLEQYERQIDTPDAAVAAPPQALQRAGTASFYAADSWMGTVANQPELDGYRDELIERGYLLVSGALRASGRERLARGEDAGVEAVEALRAVYLTLPREPPHAAVLQADRYPDDPERQIRIALASSDGFGRALQSRQKVEPGEAYTVDERGVLARHEGQLQQRHHAERWRVSERIEYNSKGLPMREYRPYFAGSHRYVRDAAWQEFGYYDTHYYDPTGRLVQTLTASGHLRRQRHLAWYTISEDENDTAAETLLKNGNFAAYFQYWERSGRPGNESVVDEAGSGPYLQLTGGGYMAQSTVLAPNARYYQLDLETQLHYQGTGKAKLTALPSGRSAEHPLVASSTWRQVQLTIETAPEDTALVVRLTGTSGEARFARLELTRAGRPDPEYA